MYSKPSNFFLTLLRNLEMCIMEKKNRAIRKALKMFSYTFKSYCLNPVLVGHRFVNINGMYYRPVETHILTLFKGQGFVSLKGVHPAYM